MVVMLFAQNFGLGFSSGLKGIEAAENHYSPCSEGKITREGTEEPIGEEKPNSSLQN